MQNVVYKHMYIYSYIYTTYTKYKFINKFLYNNSNKN